jgi:hypothetical protein
MRRVIIDPMLLSSGDITCVAHGRKLRVHRTQGLGENPSRHRSADLPKVGYARPVPKAFQFCIEDGGSQYLVYTSPLPLGRPWLVHRNYLAPV